MFAESLEYMKSSKRLVWHSYEHISLYNFNQIYDFIHISSVGKKGLSELLNNSFY